MKLRYPGSNYWPISQQAMTFSTATIPAPGFWQHKWVTQLNFLHVTVLFSVDFLANIQLFPMANHVPFPHSWPEIPNSEDVKKYQMIVLPTKFLEGLKQYKSLYINEDINKIWRKRNQEKGSSISKIIWSVSQGGCPENYCHTPTPLASG